MTRHRLLSSFLTTILLSFLLEQVLLANDQPSSTVQTVLPTEQSTSPGEIKPTLRLVPIPLNRTIPLSIERSTTLSDHFDLALTQIPKLRFTRRSKSSIVGKENVWDISFNAKELNLDTAEVNLCIGRHKRLKIDVFYQTPDTRLKFSSSASDYALTSDEIIECRVLLALIATKIDTSTRVANALLNTFNVISDSLPNRVPGE